MKKKVILGLILSLIFITCIGIGFYIVKIQEIQGSQLEQMPEVMGEKVTDECVQEGAELQLTNATEQKVSPNAMLILKCYYNECGHTTKEYLSVPSDLINLSKNEVQEKYQEWELEGFSSNEIVLKQEKQGICNEHYVLREEDERIVVYRIDENNQEKIYERTGILTKYLPETDRINIQNGIFVNGKEALNCLIEDYE